MKRLPKSVKVLTETYKVQVSKTLLKDHNAEGMLEPWSYTIFIDESILAHPRALRRVFLHELMHAYCFESGLHEFIGGQAAECTAQTLSAFVLQLGEQKLV